MIVWKSFLVIILLQSIIKGHALDKQLDAYIFLKINDSYLVYDYPVLPYQVNGQVMASLDTLASLLPIEKPLTYYGDCEYAVLKISKSPLRQVEFRPGSREITKFPPDPSKLKPAYIMGTAIERPKVPWSHTPAKLLDACRYFVPVRDFAKLFNYPVRWDANSKTLFLSVTDYGTNFFSHYVDVLSISNKDAPYLRLKSFGLSQSGKANFTVYNLTNPNMSAKRLTFATVAANGGAFAGTDRPVPLPPGQEYPPNPCKDTNHGIECTLTDYYEPLLGVDGNPGKPPMQRIFLRLTEDTSIK